MRFSSSCDRHKPWEQQNDSGETRASYVERGEGENDYSKPEELIRFNDRPQRHLPKVHIQWCIVLVSYGSSPQTRRVFSRKAAASLEIRHIFTIRFSLWSKLGRLLLLFPITTSLPGDNRASIDITPSTGFSGNQQPLFSLQVSTEHKSDIKTFVH